MAETSTDCDTETFRENNKVVKNILFIMCDQLRWDAMSCSGHPSLETPHIDALADRGVRFNRAFVQGAVCGSSRMSFYTGRYVQTHGARWNQVPLAINQLTMGDHLRKLGVRTALVGKTHMRADLEGMARLGLGEGSDEEFFLRECGFEVVERDDGLHPETRGSSELAYNQFLWEKGFTGKNPWHSAANSVLDENGNTISGWLLRAAPYASKVPESVSETAYMTDRAIDFIQSAGEERWCLHLSFIKPHWPYVAPAPYNDIYRDAEIPPPNRSSEELADQHPVLHAMRHSRIGRAMSRPDARRLVIPTYLGLVKQIDTNLGRLFGKLKELGREKDTMIVFTSDHGDYLGDHWMGEKDWLNEEIVRVPMIIVDPRNAADKTRGTVTNKLVEAIDLLPTFVESLGGASKEPEQWLEGESLIPILHHDASTKRSSVISEADWGFLEMTKYLSGVQVPRAARATMIRNDRYKYILSEVGSNLLYDLDEDPNELCDRGDDLSMRTIRNDLHEELFEWFRHRRHDSTNNDLFMQMTSAPGSAARQGIPIGYWDEQELEAGLQGKLY